MRPLLVLILVLAALAALVFGVLSFLKEPPAQPAAAPTAASAPADASQAKQPAGLEKAPAAAHIDRTIDPGKVDDPSVRSSVNASAWVYDNELTGSVLNPQSQPLSGAQVSLSTAYELIFAGDPIDTSQDQTVRTDSNGRFSFRNIEPRSKYKLTVKNKDYTLKEVTSVPVGESGPSRDKSAALRALHCTQEFAAGRLLRPWRFETMRTPEQARPAPQRAPLRKPQRKSDADRPGRPSHAHRDGPAPGCGRVRRRGPCGGRRLRQRQPRRP